MKYLSVCLALLVCATARAQVPVSYPPQLEEVPWPTQAWPRMDLPPARLEPIEQHLAKAFAPKNRKTLAGARAVVVVHRGQLVAEAYREGFSENSVFPSWSVAKSVTSALVGIAARRDLLDPWGAAPISEWQGGDNPRSAITVRHLLNMESGLAWSEGESGDNDNNESLFGSGRQDTAAYAMDKPLLHQPGTVWNYATGSSNILSRIVRDAVGGDEASYRGFIRSELTGPLGMDSAVTEFDASGNFVGGIYFYATTRDYAKFGLLYLRDGVWEGERILPPGWVDFTRTPTAASDGAYGAQFWLDTRGTRETLASRGLYYPEDMFLARGYGGQFVFIVPSRDLVIAYNGFVDYNKTSNEEDADVDVYIATLIDMFPETVTPPENQQQEAH